ncbi:MAG: phosphopentomutase [Ignavibacteriales bacterium]|nr:phosphopentomutase [Ignavibacteriales bacterium]MCB9218603.1 phosphopentomutase [Ignavibacteriales bacterium]MCB9259391.1 phosphopentomutase [Ignavibacteriales bacterium]
MNNFLLIVLDGVGIGELPDAEKFGDSGSNTLGNIANYMGGLDLPNLKKMGLGNIKKMFGFGSAGSPLASFGKMGELATGKDSTSGHWELGGLLVDFNFPLYPNGFPADLMDEFLSKNNLEGFLGNKPASGTQIIDELGDEHMQTGFPIVYTSADSVFQIAAHEDIIPIDRLYEICKITRDSVCIDEHRVGRIIARPFVGAPGSFERTTNRKDFSLDPPSSTILDVLSENDINTVGIGKVNDLFNYRGIRTQVKTKSNLEGINSIISYLKSEEKSFIFANLVDFDVYFGHRNDPDGFYEALVEFDTNLPDILSEMDETDRLIITADHGNDPTVESTDHSREYVPLLYYTPESEGKNLGTRETFSDVAKTIADFFGVSNNLKGTSFL